MRHTYREGSTFAGGCAGSILLADFGRFIERNYRLLSRPFLYPGDDVVKTARALAAELGEERAMQAQGG